MFKKDKYAIYIEALEDENAELKKKLKLIDSIPDQKLETLEKLIDELEETKTLYEDAIAAAKEAKESYESIIKGIREINKNKK